MRELDSSDVRKQSATESLCERRWNGVSDHSRDGLRVHLLVRRPEGISTRKRLEQRRLA